MLRSLSPVAMLVGLMACAQPTVRVTVESNIADPPQFQVASAQLALPPDLAAGGLIPSLPCIQGACPPPLGTSLVRLSCFNGICDPDPVLLWLPLQHVDMEQLNAELRGIVSQIDQIEVGYIRAAVPANSLNLDLAAAELYWGPETATLHSSQGVVLLGHLPLVLSGQVLGWTDIAMNPFGLQALTNHLVHVSRRFQLFVQVPLDLAPGAPVPMGELVAQLSFQVTFVGTIL